MSGSPPRRRRPAADLHIPPECRDMICKGALVAVNSSGGKDSQTMTILLARIVPRDQLVVVHAPLGEVEWPGTIEHIENTLPAGVPLIFAPVASGKSLLERVEARGKFPSMQNRFCTSDLYGDKITMESESAKALTSRDFQAIVLSVVLWSPSTHSIRKGDRHATRDQAPFAGQGAQTGVRGVPRGVQNTAASGEALGRGSYQMPGCGQTLSRLVGTCRDPAKRGRRCCNSSVPRP